MKAPNFFIVGAPKCGTTALHHYLSEHPQILMSRVKETNHYCTDFPISPRIASRPQYDALFKGATGQHLAVGESSVIYLLSREAIPNILRDQPDARFIVLFRDPVELVYAAHSTLLYGFYENEPSFEVAWRLQKERAEGRSLPPGCSFPSVLQYANIGRIGEQIERLLNVAPRNRVLILDFEEFKNSTRDVYLRVLQFLGVSDDGRVDFPQMNMNRRHAFPWLTRNVMYPPYPFNHIKNLLKTTFALSDTNVMKWLYERLTQRAPREGMSAELRAELRAVFAEDQQRLQELLRAHSSAHSSRRAA